ncbi:glycoside hydrolase family 3 C-terminal domain-containing protein [Reichenbachiella sp. ABR2-5]|uniref:Glycoside hydrolase family 3 C-terminal domain-containing protein n=2 Tax=Reichenbachiella ulvae TaxID=2980104 RepID=A0ABT3CSV0_9BACT|nr:glycoside hydrolase family 3 C-terminal domain-containing protein [Reichenbachiella ulvae]
MKSVEGESMSVIDKKVSQLMSQMTLEDKIAELTQDAPPNERLGIPMMQYSECLHGLWLPGSTVYPQAIALGSTWDPEAIREMTEAIAKEARAANLTHCYSPNLDVISGDARYGRVEESYGEDPYLVSRMGVAFIEGLQGTGEEQFDENHILATAKHYVAYPENRRGINGGFTDISERRLFEVFLPPFEAAVKEAKVGCIMPGHQDLNGIPCHMNTWLLQDILRDDWGFDGFIVSDNNDVSRLNLMHFIAKNRTEAAVMGLQAGVDMDLVIGKDPANSAYIMKVLGDTLKSNPELVQYVDESVSRILKMKYKLGLFDQKDTNVVKEVISTTESQELALELAKKSVVLLKNEGELLPLNKDKINSIALIGPNAHEEVPEGGRYTLMGGYSGIPPYYTSLLEGLTDKVDGQIKINYAEGCKLNSDSKAGFAAAIAAAKKSDVVILAVGGSTRTCGEGTDRDDLDLVGVQNELVEEIHKLGKPVIVVLINGRPLTINYIAENIPAVIESWYLGMRSGDALADVIFGDYNPGGKLTVSFPRSVGQIPVTYLERPDFVGSGKGLYKFSDKSPLFSFGYGLSYTSFEYSEPRLNKGKIRANEAAVVSVDITNTGNRVGDEVVQMYIRDEFASVGRYNMMLKGFERVSLAPGETKTVEFELNAGNLFIYDKDMKKVVEPGDFTVSIGASSRIEDLKKTNLRVY